MPDILPEEQPLWEKIEAAVKSVANFYNFSRISTPILEEEGLFIKGTGKSTDIVVGKQMYSFRTKGGEKVALRPEFTPSVIRAYIENGMESLPKPVKLWSFGPLFRYERPQKGRYRQFWQFNFEILGDKSPAVDALLIQLFSNLLKALSLSKWRVEVNSIGCEKCRKEYLHKLKSYYRQKVKEICPLCKKRLKINPLRVLDCKEEKCQRVKKFAPQIVNSLCEDCHLHFKSFLEFLDAMDIPYILNPYLVRGLDYYGRTVFEFLPLDKKEAQQSALIAGGRYDTLVQELGGKPTPAIGAAGGIERIIEEMKEAKIDITKIKIEDFKEKPKIFLVQLGNLAKRKALKILEEFKRNKIKIVENIGKDSLKAQLSRVGKMKIKYSLILGQKEALEETIILRNMETGIQKIIPLKNLIKEVKKKIK